MDEIVLVAQNKKNVPLKLYNYKKHYQIEDILKIDKAVYSDEIYSITYEETDDISDISVYINDDNVEISYDEKNIKFGAKNRAVFSETIGLVQISIRLELSNGEVRCYYSEYISVLIKSSENNASLDLMLKYIYANQGDILKQEVKVTGKGEVLEQKFDDFWSQIILLEDISNVYERNYGYFKANSRYKLKKNEVLDRIEKIQSIDSKTLQYLSQHPELLKKSSIGLKYGKQYFMPTKALMMQNEITYDIYENQVVKSFLELILNSILNLSEKIDHYLELFIFDDYIEGYIVSTHLLYENAKETLNEFRAKTAELENKFKKLLMSYDKVFNFKSVNMQKMPRATAIFQNVPQYNRIYTCILKWFSKSGYDFASERAMLSFMKAPTIYEAYVLIKLINQIKERGYTLRESRQVEYPKEDSWRYEHHNYNNMFIFEDENSTITLYYEPVIYNDDKTYLNNLYLYRNTSVSLKEDNPNESTGSYYVPDYVIKYEESGKASYIICDAKFSYKKKVKYGRMPYLIYRYISSISPLKDNVDVKGLYVFYALTHEENMESFYDFSVGKLKIATPYVEMVPLSEMIPISSQQKNSKQIFKDLIDR